MRVFVSAAESRGRLCRGVQKKNPGKHVCNWLKWSLEGYGDILGRRAVGARITDLYRFAGGVKRGILSLESSEQKCGIRVPSCGRSASVFCSESLGRGFVCSIL